MREYLVISTSVDLVRAASDDVLFVAADGNYSSLVFTGGEVRMVTLQLGQVERLLGEQLVQTRGNFVRIGKSLIVNRTYICYINLTKQQLVLSAGGTSASHTLSASREALKQLKLLIEGEVR